MMATYLHPHNTAYFVQLPPFSIRRYTEYALFPYFSLWPGPLLAYTIFEFKLA